MPPLPFNHFSRHLHFGSIALVSWNFATNLVTLCSFNHCLLNQLIISLLESEPLSIIYRMPLRPHLFSPFFSILMFPSNAPYYFEVSQFLSSKYTFLSYVSFTLSLKWCWLKCSQYIWFNNFIKRTLKRHQHFLTMWYNAKMETESNPAHSFKHCCFWD